MNKNELLELLKNASEAYYNNKELILSDEEYDSLMQLAEEKGWLVQDDKINDGAKLNFSKGVIHTKPMKSLKKANSEKELEAYYKETKNHGAESYVIEPKLDGLALSIYYDENNEIILSTRGNGNVGENVTYLLKDKNLNIKNIPLEKPNEKIKELRGELFSSKKDLIINNKNKPKDKFSNERSAVAGIVSKSKLGLDYKGQLTFVTYFAIDTEDNFVKIPKTIFNARDLFPSNRAYSFEELLDNVNKAKLWREECMAPTDGIVIKPIENITIGETNHHPKEYIAFKYPGEQKVTTVEDISFTIGNTGKITPRVKISPITIDGVTITNITGNNFKWLQEKKVSKEAEVLVKRANDVIPAIVMTIKESDKELKIPKVCPYCNNALDYKYNEQGQESKDLFCLNPNCESRKSYMMTNIVGKQCLDIDGLSGEVLKTLKLESVVDLMNLDLKELEEVKFDSSGVSLGKIRAKLIYDNIQKAKNDTQPYRWLLSFGIPTLGSVTAKKILKEFESLEELFYDKNKSVKKIKSINGLGNAFVKSFEEYFEIAKTTFNELNSIGCVMDKFDNITVKGYYCHTGKVPQNFKNRDELISELEKQGWIFTKSINKDTNILLTEDKTKMSSKMKKAASLNIPIMTYQEFLNHQK